MPLFKSGRAGKRQRGDVTQAGQRIEDQGGFTLEAQDTLAAINELSQLVKNNPDLVEIYLALGNLYRAQGEIERAVHIRTSLILRPGLNPRFKARALYELGRDYKRGGFVDRAMDAFDEAISLAGRDHNILYEVAKLAAASNDYERAAKYYAQLDNEIAHAYYLVRQAVKHFDAGDASQGKKVLQKALKVYPGSVEAWLASIMHAATTGNMKKVVPLMQEAFQVVPQKLHFVILDGVLNAISDEKEFDADTTTKEEISKFKGEELCIQIDSLFGHEEQDLLFTYYGALFYLACGNHRDAQAWLERALLLNNDFWAARLDLLDLTKELHDDLLPSFTSQLDFFTQQARQLKRFICRSCGLKREQTFFVCPRCQSWHSIGFRLTLHE